MLLDNCQMTMKQTMLAITHPSAPPNNRRTREQMHISGVDSYQRLPFVTQGRWHRKGIRFQSHIHYYSRILQEIGYCSQFLLQLELSVQPCDERYNEIFNTGLHLSVWQKDSAGVQWTAIYFHLSFAKVVLHDCETILHFLNVLALNWNSK